MFKANKLHPFVILLLAGMGIYFFSANYLNWFPRDKIITNITVRFTKKVAPPSLETDKDYLGTNLASVPEEFSLGKNRNRGFKDRGKLALFSDPISIPFPQNKGDSYKWSPSDGYIIDGTVDSIARNTDSKSFGVNLKNDLGRFIYYDNSVRAGAIVFFNNQEGVHRFRQSADDKNQWIIEEMPYHDVVCASAGTTYPMLTSSSGYPRHSRQMIQVASNIASGTQLNSSNFFQSKPDAPTVIYCNFEGEVVNQPLWSFSTINAAPSGLSNEAVLEILKVVAEDFAPFNVNVTNDRSIYDSTASNKRVMCISTPTDTAAPGSGGVAYLDSFRDDLVCWDFNLDGDTISHEVGHTLNLDHHGDSTQSAPEYHNGHSSESRTWAPIMGASSKASMVQWSDGNYTFATNSNQDDLYLITNYGLSFRADDYGNNTASGEDVSISNMLVTRNGIIERNTDADVFNVTYSSFGKVQISGVGIEGIQSNLDVKLSIENSAGVVIFEQTSDSTDDALTELILEPGSYQVIVEGDSSGNPYGNPATGWSSYGSLGQYQLSFFPDPLFSDAIEQYSPVNMTGDADWIAQIKNTYDGEDAAESGSISGNQSSNFSISKNTTSVSFWYKVSSENNYDFFEFFIDGSRRIKESGEVGWVYFSEDSLSNTNHTFEWRYAKDAYVIEGADRAWVDKVSFDQVGGYLGWSSNNNTSEDGTLDSDGDGIIDLVEYLVAGSSLTQDGSHSISLNSSTREFVLRRDSASADLIIRLLVSDDLENWTPVAVSYEGNSFSTTNGLSASDSPLNGSLVETKITISPTNETKKFAKLEIVLK